LQAYRADDLKISQKQTQVRRVTIPFALARELIIE
jgi:hypothetical protein